MEKTSPISKMLNFVRFKRIARGDSPMPQEATSAVAGLQSFLDDVASTQRPQQQHDWFQIDVAAMFSSTPIMAHELNKETGAALLFLNESLVLLCPEQTILHHFPRHLIHCFVEDCRTQHQEEQDVVYRIELFSISPLEEQLCWVVKSMSEHEVPRLQAQVARWLGWLNRS